MLAHTSVHGVVVDTNLGMDSRHSGQGNKHKSSGSKRDRSGSGNDSGRCSTVLDVTQGRSSKVYSPETMGAYIESTGGYHGSQPAYTTEETTLSLNSGDDRQRFLAQRRREAEEKTSAHAKNRKRYLRACKQLGIAPLSRLIRQIGGDKIVMSCEGIGPKDVNAICSALLNHEPIEELNLSSNGLTCRVLPYISKLLDSKTNITKLDLSDNTLGGGRGLELLAKLTKRHNLIRDLNVSGNRITDTDAVAVASIITDSMGLWTLNLSHNELREKGGLLIGDALTKNDSMYNLDLSWNHLRGRGAECLALGIMKNTNLSTLNISWNGFGFEGCIAMAMALKHNTSLVELDISSNRIHPPGIWELWKGLCDNTTLRILKVGRNPLPTYCTTPLLCKIRNTPGVDLELLDMSNIVVDDEFEGVIDEVRESRPDFMVIYERSLLVRKEKWEDHLSGNTKTVYNVDPVRVLFFLKKNLRIVDLFNKMDTDNDARLTRIEVHEALKTENFNLSGSAIDAIFDYLDDDNNGYIELGELMLGERRHKRERIRDAEKKIEREKLDVEKSDKDGLAMDAGGMGGRFSTTYRKKQSDDLNAESLEKLQAKGKGAEGATPRRPSILPPINDKR